MLFLLLAIPAAGEADAPPRPPGLKRPLDLPRGARACLVCHKPPYTDADQLPGSAHRNLECAQCHPGYDFSTHRSAADELSAEDAQFVDKAKEVSSSPRALVACAGCHDEVQAKLAGSVHGRWLKEDRPTPGPVCTSCHGSPHAITKAAARTGALVQARSARCAACHGNPAMTEKAGLSRDAAPTYQDSIHGRMVQLGNSRAPSCSDCHGSHAISPKAEKASPVGAEHKAETCAKCHSGASARFASIITHQPLGHGAHPGPHWTHIFFSYLTTLTLLGLFLHILLDLGAELRHRLAKRKGTAHGPHIPAHLPRTVLRLDIHQRIQHWMLIASVVLLTLTGWPIRAAQVGPSQSLASFFGGPAFAGILHRVAAVVMIGAGVYHIVYLVALAVRNRLRFSMVPTPKDLVDASQNIAYFLGLRPERPRFERFSYVEKFDYWAVFWGVAIMAGTGFVYWFPVGVTRLMPPWIVTSAQLAHGEEATLCALALFVWHFYNVHLRPSIFPMNWAWLHGEITIETLREEHAAEYERLFPKAAKEERK